MLISGLFGITLKEMQRRRMKLCAYILCICAGAPFSATAPALANVANLNYGSVATGVDNGPQDGIFDSFATPNLGSVNNNGFTSFRTAFEFGLSGIPAGSTINSARLTMVFSNFFEGTRSIAVHGYAGDGVVQLSDFALNGLVGTASVNASTPTLTFDVTNFVAGLVANGKSFAGFNVREEPANTSNFTVMLLALTGFPVLSIDFSIGGVHAPEAHVGADQTVNEGTLVTLDGSASFDPDGDSITYAWTQTSGPAVELNAADSANPTFTAPLITGGLSSFETLTFSLTVSDGDLSDTIETTVVVENVDHAPVANAGDPQTVHSGKAVTLDGSGSSDPDGDPITYQWEQVDGPAVQLADATGISPGFTAPPVNGTTALTFRLIVSDSQMTSDPADVVITVKNGPPLCNLGRALPGVLWPPNHKMVPVSITGVTDPDDGTIAIRVTGVTQDEPVNGLGDGDTSPDATIQDEKVLLRAERSGKGNGRIYWVNFTADDGEGGTCVGTANVGVPQSMKPGTEAVDDGQLYDSTQP